MGMSVHGDYDERDFYAQQAAIDILSIESGVQKCKDKKSNRTTNHDAMLDKWRDIDEFMEIAIQSEYSSIYGEDLWYFKRLNDWSEPYSSKKMALLDAKAYYLSSSDGK